MFRRLTDTLESLIIGLGILFGGFWLLYLAFLNSNLLQGVGGGGMVLLGMGIMARARRPIPGSRP